MRKKKKGEEVENIKTRGAQLETPTATELRPKRFLTIGIYRVRADYLAQRGGAAATAEARECTLHQRAREKNDERVYARLNLFNVET